MSGTFNIFASHNMGLFLFLDLLAELVLDLVGAPRLDVRIKDHINLFEGPTSSLGIHEEHVEGHDTTEYTENYIGLPLDVVECRRDEVGQGKVENPVSRGG